mmetsp:Transcript_11542/g.28850  ORF Transcript_11542/g.28850 Transcript_11542/m.28850 type:complete len:94 (-) Transcript_11542:210-491(-)
MFLPQSRAPPCSRPATTLSTAPRGQGSDADDCNEDDSGHPDVCHRLLGRFSLGRLERRQPRSLARHLGLMYEPLARFVLPAVCGCEEFRIRHE